MVVVVVLQAILATVVQAHIFIQLMYAQVTASRRHKQGLLAQVEGEGVVAPAIAVEVAAEAALEYLEKA